MVLDSSCKRFVMSDLSFCEAKANRCANDDTLVMGAGEEFNNCIIHS